MQVGSEVPDDDGTGFGAGGGVGVGVGAVPPEQLGVVMVTSFLRPNKKKYKTKGTPIIKK